jgi:hypothetical protein
MSVKADHWSAESALKLLRQVEWGSGAACPVCFVRRETKHLPDCSLAWHIAQLEVETRR